MQADDRRGGGAEKGVVAEDGGVAGGVVGSGDAHAGAEDEFAHFGAEGGELRGEWGDVGGGGVGGEEEGGG